MKKKEEWIHNMTGSSVFRDGVNSINMEMMSCELVHTCNPSN